MVRTKDVFKSYVGNGTVYRCSSWSVRTLTIAPRLAVPHSQPLSIELAVSSD